MAMMCLISWTTTPSGVETSPFDGRRRRITRRTFGQALGLAAAAQLAADARRTPRSPHRHGTARGRRAQTRRCATSRRSSWRRASGGSRCLPATSWRPISRGSSALNPKVNADRHAGGGARAGRRGARGRADGAWRSARCAARAAGGAQGSRRHRGHPHDARVAVLPRSRADGRRADRDAAARGRRDHLRQDQHAGARRRIADLQRGLRRDAQPVRRDEDLRRQQRRRGGGAGLRDGADRRRQRHRRIAPQSRGLLQRRRLPPLAGPRAGRRRTWSPLSVSGPMARTVADVALVLSAIAGPDAARTARDRSKIGATLSRAARSRLQGRPGRVVERASAAFPFEPDIRRVVDGNRRVFESLGCRVEDAEPDFDGRRSGVSRRSDSCPITRSTPRSSGERPEWVKDTIKYEVADGRANDGRGHRARDGPAVADVRAEPAVLRALRLLRPAGDAGLAVRRERRRIPPQIAGTPMATYIDWMRSCWYVTFMSNPAISVPAGFTTSGLARRPSDRRPAPRRLERAADGPCLRAGDATRQAACAHGDRVSRRRHHAWALPPLSRMET